MEEYTMIVIIITVGTIVSAIVGLLFLLSLIMAGNFSYDGFVLATHMPEPDDYLTTRYRLAAIEKGDDFLFQMEKKKWEDMGLVVVDLNKEGSFLNSILWSIQGNNIYSSYKGKRVVGIQRSNHSHTFTVTNGLNRYKDNGTYEVIAQVNEEFVAVSKDGKVLNRAHINDNKTDNWNWVTYKLTINADPVRKFYGGIDMNWKLIDSELRKTFADDNEIVNAINNLEIPGTKEETKEMRHRKAVENEKPI